MHFSKNIYVRSIKTSIKLKYSKRNKNTGWRIIQFFLFKKAIFQAITQPRLLIPPPISWLRRDRIENKEMISFWIIPWNNNIHKTHPTFQFQPFPLLLLNAQNNNKPNYGTKYCTWQGGICYFYYMENCGLRENTFLPHLL